jgi:hypothetical protein
MSDGSEIVPVVWNNFFIFIHKLQFDWLKLERPDEYHVTEMADVNKIMARFHNKCAWKICLKVRQPDSVSLTISLTKNFDLNERQCSLL